MSEHELIRFGVSISDGLLQKFDALIERQSYTNRSEALRDLIRDRLAETELQERMDGCKAVGAITLIYDHQTREIGDRLTDIAHDHHQIILSSMHVHLTHTSCMEVVLVKGCGKELRALSDKLSSIKGVKHGKLAMTRLVEDDL